MDELLIHAAKAVKASSQSETPLDGKSVSIAVVGEGCEFRMLAEEEVAAVLRDVDPEAMEVDPVA